MKNRSNTPEILIQVISAFVVNFGLYIFLALTDYQGGIDGFLGMIFIQPIYGCIVSYLLTVVCLIIGLPIRLISKVRAFFQKNYLVFISIFILGLILYILSFTDYFSSIIQVNEDGYLRFVFQPNWELLVIGWFLICFSVLHFYYPSLSKNKAKFSASVWT